ncbi:MAG: winged helix-turn-helix domain-containing protein [Dokdonella sp.]|uniref:winged helix-turn-helix domain-containing protein n=1 Tax=Dokdonella sp. TaxID=2291710 RepID=UPI003F7FFE73
MNYRFGRWRIAPQARELWHDERLQPVARRVFECLAYLIEHRERAVGRDELVAALWGRVDVADVLVSQLIARTRRTIGDDAQAQRAIRTVPGFGYRWVMPIEAIDPSVADDAPVGATAAPPAAPAASADGAAATVPADAPARPRKRRGVFVVLAFAAVASIAMAAWQFSMRHPAPAPVAPAAPADAEVVLVLPFDVAAAREQGWLRLGAMDLVAERLRAAQLAVPPSDSVVAALHAHAAADEARREQDAVEAFNPRLVVRGRVRQSSEGWLVELDAVDDRGTSHRVSATRAQPTEAARQASGLLLAALGHRGAADEEGGADPLDDRLQRVQAAILGSEYDLARELIEQSSPAEQNDPQLRYRSAQIEFHLGRIEQADTILRALLADPATLPFELRTNVLVSRGMLAMRRGDCAAAEPWYDAAVRVAEADGKALAQGNALAGRGLARACLHRYDDASNDLGLARARMAAAGDALGLARVDNYLGLLDADRRRLADALVDFRAAAATFERFGVVDAQRAVLNGQLEVQADLLQHADALASSERLWALRAQIGDPGQRLALAANRARALIDVGHLQAAAQVLAATADDLAAATEAGYAHYVHAQGARLAERLGDRERAVAEARLALAAWPRQPDDPLRERTAWLLARAGVHEFAEGVLDDTSPYAALVLATRARAQGDAPAAERHYERALAAAEQRGVPATVADAAIAYAGWLLERGDARRAAEIGGRVARWADRDFDCAELQVALYQALGREDLRLVALRQADALAGERQLRTGLRDAAAPPAHS